MKTMKTSRVALASALFAVTTVSCVIEDQQELSASDISSEYSSLTAVSQDGRYIVKFKNQAGRAAAHAAGGTVALELAEQGAAAMYLPEAALNGLRNNPNVEYVEVDERRYPMAATDPYGLGEVQADVIRADSANPVQQRIKVCIIDSGIKGDHPEFSSLSVAGTNDSGTGAFNQDTCGHGTHVAGTVAGAATGVAPDSASLHIVKVFNGADCAWTFSSSLVTALNQCEAAGAKVVSMSLGGTVKSRTEDSAFAGANSRGILSIAAAGNGGNTQISYPAGYASVMSVAAIDSNRAIATFSQQNADVEIAAPGVAVKSSYPFEASLAVGTQKFHGSNIEGAPFRDGSGALVNGGRCATTGAFAGKVVLCERGDIAFVDKVRNVEASGGAAAVIYNNVPGGFSGTLGTGVTSTIPAISLSQEEGQLLVSTLLGSSGLVHTGAGNGYALLDGTSMATPHVSGVAAAVWSRVPTATNQEIRDALNATALDLGTAGRDNTFGFGLVQAKAALDFILAGGGGECLPASSACSAGSDCCSGVCAGKGNNKRCQ
jgi:subtilisin family serine protease